MPNNKKLFLSAVSREFAAYRLLLADDLKRPNLDVAVQEDFIVTGGSTLEKLDDYIRYCDGIIHLVGKATGSPPEEAEVAALLARHQDFAANLPPLAAQLALSQPGFSYTQWEAYLAIYHKRPLFVYRPTDFELDALEVPRGPQFVFNAAEAQSQKEHYQRICQLGRDRGQFLNEERLSSAVLRDLVEILPRLEVALDVPPTRLRHTAERLIGREEDLARLDVAWNDSAKNVVVVRAFGGMGKTSLVATWMAELALKNWRGAERVFDWSFYSQGTRDQSTASSDTFIEAALTAFGDPDPKLGSPWDRGARLAQLVAEVRALLVLDGLEPLQHPPGPMEGKLRDAAIEALLKGLAGKNAGLCVVTTREKVDDIKRHYGRTADDFPLTQLSDLAGAALLHYCGATRAGAKELESDDRELQKASREVRGHGLTLQLVGQYLRLVENGDILKRDTVRLAEADQEYQNDATRPYGHAFKAMEAYERWFESEGEIGKRQLSALKLLGLFDRPASQGCIEALRAAPAIADLTVPLVGLSDRQWRLVLGRLKDINLLGEQEDGALDAHPLLREYFARQLREQHADEWRAGHRRIYEYLCESTPEKDEPTLEDLQPLYQAVAHGCQAGLQQEACDDVYFTRIQRRGDFYSIRQLGAISSDLGAIACFFDPPWTYVSRAISVADQGWMLGEAAVRLRALGRLTEAIEPLQAALKMGVDREGWESAAVRASNLSELELTLGYINPGKWGSVEVTGAVGDAELSMTYAERSGGTIPRILACTTHADALHQAGRRADAELRFRDAEQIQQGRQSDLPLLYSVPGFRYCELLLASSECGAWQAALALNSQPSAIGLVETCRAVSQRTAQTLNWAEQNNLSVHTVALDHLTLGRAALYEEILSKSEIRNSKSDIEQAVTGLRRAGQVHELLRGLLTRVWLWYLTGACTGPDSAQADLDEAWEIAERGPMRLFMADIHLYRARLFFHESNYPWESPEADLAAAGSLIEECGYGRRREELEDAEAALKLHRS